MSLLSSTALIVLLSIILALPFYLEHRDLTQRTPLPPPSLTARPFHAVLSIPSSSSPIIDGLPSSSLFRVYYELHGHCPFDPTSPSSIRPSDTYNGETVLLINPTGGATHLWGEEGSQTVPSLLKAGYCVILYDQRGQGRSEVAPGHYSIPMLAADAASLLQHLNVPPVHLVSWSLGAGVAHVLTLEHPQLVKSVVVTGFLSFFEPSFVGAFFASPTVIRMMGMGMYGKLSMNALNPRDSESERKMAELFLTNDIEGYIKTSSAWARNYNVTERLKEIAVPMIQIHGERDDEIGLLAEYKNRI